MTWLDKINLRNGVYFFMFNYKLWGLEAGIITFIAVTALVFYGNTTFFDTYYGGLIQGLRTDGLNTVAELITYIGNWQSIVVICLLLLAFEKTRKTYGIPVTISAILSTVINKIVKIQMARPRPDAANMLIEQDGFSYASGHTVTAVAVFFLIAYLLCKNMDNKWKSRIAAFFLVVLALLIGLSRIYLGVHYASDVFGGFFLGLAVFCLVALIFYPHKREKEKWKAKKKAKRDALEEVKAEVID